VLRRLGMPELAYDIATLAANKAQTAVKTNPAAATIGNPFVNSLGMAFVPTGTRGILFCRTDTTVEHWRRFLRSSLYSQPKGMYVLTETEDKPDWLFDKNAFWNNPGFKQTSDHPVVGVSWNDANAFCKWLSKEEGRTYRMPTDAEWSEAAGAERYPWGGQWPPPRDAGNYPGEELSIVAEGRLPRIAGFRDEYPFTSPVGKFHETNYGLFDMGGNVWQWCQDEYKASMNEASVLEVVPLFKNPTSLPSNPLRVTRGGAWCFASEPHLRTMTRKPCESDSRVDYIGFRCVLDFSGD